jgi:hypothetical protein
VHRTLKRNDMSRVRDMDPPTGEPMRIIRYEHERPGDMVHVDIKKVGRIPKGGGWAVHGQGTDEARASKRKAARTGKVGYAYLHSAVDDYSRLAYTGCRWPVRGSSPRRRMTIRSRSHPTSCRSSMTSVVCRQRHELLHLARTRWLDSPHAALYRSPVAYRRTSPGSNSSPPVTTSS